MSKWSAYKSTQKNGSIAAQISTTYKKHIQENREYVKCLIDISLYFGRQGISFRGHRENEESFNKGTNYLLEYYKILIVGLLVIIKF